ncbi:MAG: response regulator [Ignavibacteria bacterium]|jgi:CheY-like chemotaxis protein
MNKKEHTDTNKSLKKVSHDINNILTSIINSAENLIIISSLNDEQLSLLKNIKRNASLASQLINEKLLKKKSKQLYKESITLKKITDDLAVTLNQILKRDVSFIQKNTSDKIIAYANYNDLYRVLLNLCTNANDAIESKGEIEIDYCLINKKELSKLTNTNLLFESYCKITVKDNGNGIEESNLTKIFDEGFSTKDRTVESGFGLNIVKEIINNHDGYIYVNSQVGIGTTFEIYLPSFPDDAFGEHEKRILIADDEQPVRESLAELLESYNYKISQAKNGSEVLKLFHDDDKIDLLIIDKNMPVIDGIECIKKINEKKYNTRIILITGYELEDDEVAEINKMADKIISKPYNFYELLNHIFNLTKN